MGPRPDEDPVEHYLSVIADKTGSLVAASGQLGAIFAGADEAYEPLLVEYGEKVGVAFQLADDVIDIASEAGDTGKTPGTDLREGKATLPVLYARRSQDPADHRLLDLLDADLRDDALLSEALGLLRVHPAMNQAQQHTYAVAQAAADSLAGLPDSEAKAALVALATTVVDRSG